MESALFANLFSIASNPAIILAGSLSILFVIIRLCFKGLW